MRDNLINIYDEIKINYLCLRSSTVPPPAQIGLRSSVVRIRLLFAVRPHRYLCCVDVCIFVHFFVAYPETPFIFLT